MTLQEWKNIITSAMTSQKTIVNGHTYLGMKWNSFSGPVLLKCDDNNEYVVKGFNAGRSIINDHVIGRFGLLLGASVPRVILVNVPADLILHEPQMGHMIPGLCHGSAFIQGCTERECVKYVDHNRDKFALFAVLYGWAHAGDHQFIYRNSHPNDVFSVDHGHFFPGGPDWTIQSLRSSNSPYLDGDILRECNIFASDKEIKDAIIRLKNINDGQIAQTISLLPEQWAITIDERAELALYLSSRRDLLVESILGGFKYGLLL